MVSLLTELGKGPVEYSGLWLGPKGSLPVVIRRDRWVELEVVRGGDGWMGGGGDGGGGGGGGDSDQKVC